MIKFDVETIHFSKHRYPTVGDYATDAFGTVHIKVTEMQNWKYELAIAIHEAVEKYLCKAAGIKEEDIDAFDIQYEKTRLPDDYSEPGDRPEAPYHKQHLIATVVEKCFIETAGANWDEYEKAINHL